MNNNIPVSTEKPMKAPGMGEYGNYDVKSSTVKTIAEIVLHILLDVTVISGAVFTAIFCPYSLIVSIPLAIGVVAFSTCEIKKLIDSQSYAKNIAPSTSSLGYNEKLKDCPGNYEWDTKITGAAALKDPLETFDVKLQMIRQAEQEILISGSYCGRQAFDKVLDEIEKRMEEKPDLRTCILSATRFMTDQDKFGAKNWKKVKELTEKYPDRFFFDVTFETAQNNPYNRDFKYVSNHTKLMVVDRKVMITGGSGIEDRWMNHDGLHDVGENGQQAADEGFVNSKIARAFRDKDFIFYADNNDSSIQTSVFEFYKLMTRWHHFSATRKRGHKQLQEIEKRRGEEHKIPVWNDFHRDIQTKGARIEPGNLNLEADFVKPGRVKLFASGPEMEENKFEKEIIKRIDEAKTSIVINHMYIHPTKAVRKAVTRALDRGVDVTIITNDKQNMSPGSHIVFAPRTIHNVRKMGAGKLRKNLHLFTWNKKNVTNHQKMIVIDNRYLFCGSSNFGYKGLDSMSDYEHNLLVDSPDLCKSLQESLEKDKDACTKVSKEEVAKSGTFSEHVAAFLHEKAQKKIG
jgi:phosphatidylserine/phosphatidylglycerophosphate/cardiolipin synthase-like enzyme